MNDISTDLKKVLDVEQEKIIKSNDKYIFVSACPGSGKTYTIVRKIEKELNEIDEYKGIIACSFTQESSEELKNRIDKKIALNNSFIGTIDSFIKNIIYMFVNRALISCDLFDEKVILGNKVYFPEKEVKINGNYVIKNNEKKLTINELTRYYDQNERLRKIGVNYYNEWLKKIKNSQYEISFPTYFFASYIVKLDVFQKWFNNKFSTIYIDEAQDLNYFQHYFFKTIKENTNINIIMVGDAYQSIYQFRGARPELFKALINKGYSGYKINISVRCHPSIMYYANKIYDQTIEKSFQNESHVQMIDKLDLGILNKLEGSIFILAESNAIAQKIYEKYKDDFDIIYTKKLDFDNKRYNDYYESSNIIDELLKYFLNYDNILDKYKYPFENIEPILLNCNVKVNPKDFRLSLGHDLKKFLKNSCQILDISLSENTINEIINKLENEQYKYYYYVVEKKNRIMTIHASKGLEADNIIVILDNPYNKINEEFKNKLFVAITRARKNAYIISFNNNDVYDFVVKLLE